MSQSNQKIARDAVAPAAISLGNYLAADTIEPLFVQGDAVAVLRQLPSASVDMVMTSPPYWGQREYGVEGIGLEERPESYVQALLEVGREIHRILKPTGSFWLNIGDAYRAKSLLGLPWRVAIGLTDQCGFKLRNDVIWHKLKGGMDQSRDKLSNMHEHLFHLTKGVKYYYDVDSLRRNPRESRVENGRVISATGVSGVRYQRQIELSTVLTPSEKVAATKALRLELEKIARNEIADFRMIIRGQQRATHSDRERVSGRAKELVDKGFYFLRYHPDGAKLGDVWDILPESTKREHSHYAAYPEDLCKRPIAATCPVGGLVLDPFCGTGTTMRVAKDTGRRSIGIDLSADYLAAAAVRCAI